MPRKDTETGPSLQRKLGGFAVLFFESYRRQVDMGAAPHRGLTNGDKIQMPRDGVGTNPIDFVSLYRCAEGSRRRPQNPRKVDLEPIEVETGGHFNDDDTVPIEDDHHCA